MNNDNSNESKMQVWKRVSADNDHINIDLKNLDNKYKEDFENIVSCVIRGYLLRLCSHNFKRASKQRIYFGYDIGSSDEYMLQLVYDSLLFHAVTTFGTDIVSKQDIEEIYREFPCHGMVILKTDDQKSEVYQLYFYRRNKLIDGDKLKMQLQISQTICGENYNEQEALSTIVKAILMYPVAHFTKGSGKIISTDSFNEGSADEAARFVNVADKYRRKKELAFYEKLIRSEEDDLKKQLTEFLPVCEYIIKTESRSAMKPECLSKYLRYREILESIPKSKIELLTDEERQAYTELSALFDILEPPMAERLPDDLVEYCKQVYDSKFISKDGFDYHKMSPLAMGYLSMIYPAYLCGSEEEIEEEMEIRIRFDKEQLMKKCKELMDRELMEDEE